MAIEDARYDGLGQSLAELAPPSAQIVLLYVEFDDGVLSARCFYEGGGLVHQVLLTPQVFDELEFLQKVFGPTVRAMEFKLVDGSFASRFGYWDGPFDPAGFDARTDAALVRTFGHANAVSAP